MKAYVVRGKLIQYFEINVFAHTAQDAEDAVMNLLDEDLIEGAVDQSMCLTGVEEL